jgi:hypothetical protein
MTIGSIYGNCCECCGVKYEATGQNAVWTKPSVGSASALCNHICLYCAGNIPQTICEIACGLAQPPLSATWHQHNYMNHPELKRRIEDVQKMSIGLYQMKYIIKPVQQTFAFHPDKNHDICPRCKGGLVKKESESIFGEKYSVKKCNNCGYCD